MGLRLAEDRPPVPPADLMLRVVLPFAAQDIEDVRQTFDVEALAHLRHFERALAGLGRSFEDFDRLLDFGCGCGRFLRHLGQLADQVEIYGTDIDAEMIEWLRANVTYGQYEVGPHEPPLLYPDHHFDLVINHSVFTHLDERLQDLWLGELQRITKPDGLLLLTVEGQSSWNRTSEACERAGESSERWRGELESRGILFISDDLLVGSSHPDFYHSAIHAPWYVFEHWTRFFDIAAYLPDGSISQDLVVMRRRADAAPAPRPIGRRLSSPEPATLSSSAPTAGPTSMCARLHEALGALRRNRLSPRGGPGHDDGPPIPQRFDPQGVMREIAMLRVGLYEQGRRISVLAAQLRDEISESRNGAGSDEP